jgi:hypothetical protein
MGEKSRFIDEEIEVRSAQEPGPPTSFVWHGQEYRIVEIEKAYRRLDFKRAWWRRRHRDYYRVKTDTGQVFEIYFNRGPGKRYWVLYREFIA